MESQFCISFAPNFYPTNYIIPSTFHFETMFIQTLSFQNFSAFALNSFLMNENDMAMGPSLTQTQISSSAINNSENIEQNQIEKNRIDKIVRSKKSLKMKRYRMKRHPDSRNVVSNLLKIFFKSLLDARKWDSQIRGLIQKHRCDISAQSFYQWIAGFKINYKNYIKVKDIRKLLSGPKYDGHLFIFRSLLKHFVQIYGVVHCLTSRRIERAAIIRHIEGLREIESFARGEY